MQPILVQPMHQVRRQPVRALDAVAGRRLYLLRMQQTPAQVCSFLSVTAGSGWLGTPVSGHCQSGITHTPMAHSKLSAATGRTMTLTCAVGRYEMPLLLALMMPAVTLFTRRCMAEAECCGADWFPTVTLLSPHTEKPCTAIAYTASGQAVFAGKKALTLPSASWAVAFLPAFMPSYFASLFQSSGDSLASNSKPSPLGFTT